MNDKLFATQPAFCEATFRANAAHFADLWADYADLGVDTLTAANWATFGFLPDEARPWIEAGFSAGRASVHANAFRAIEQALARDGVAS